MKTSRELIEELQAEARDVTAAAIIVRFPHGEKYLFASAKPSPLTLLEEMVKEGGRPIAIVAVKQGGFNEVKASARALDESVNKPVLLDTLVLRFRRYVETHGLCSQNP